jgi:hypothetical protein
MKTLNIPPYREELIYNQRYPPSLHPPTKQTNVIQVDKIIFFFCVFEFSDESSKMKTVSDVEFVRVRGGVNFSKLKEN